MQTRKTRIVVFASLFWYRLANLCLIAHAAAPAKQLVPGDQAVTLMYDGRERISIVHMPRGASEARAVPVMHIHSVDDPRAIYSDGLGPPFSLTNNRVFRPSIDRMIVR